MRPRKTQVDKRSARVLSQVITSARPPSNLSATRLYSFPGADSEGVLAGLEEANN